MHIKDYWNRIDHTTQKWLIDNPGCQILPRTITAVIRKETGETDEGDQHGEAALSQEDRDFIRARANDHPPYEYRFFDSTQP
ncbi:hypothetical protein ASG92_16480 [Arthrobacter sp. Soil736]|uniref:hypothetical protein n=1 Tax=Arthrobacter sp. Soil736 TaxID=1736395 RepID=UPI0006F2F587|nr:hypothetical protein [Arthrobacter sp. Soil736]KRE66189.1 hypothetical protein ASG92_16480 [Arthrobacter sp. Soil736]